MSSTIRRSGTTESRPDTKRNDRRVDSSNSTVHGHAGTTSLSTSSVSSTPASTASAAAASVLVSHGSGSKIEGRPSTPLEQLLSSIRYRSMLELEASIGMFTDAFKFEPGLSGESAWNYYRTEFKLDEGNSVLETDYDLGDGARIRLVEPIPTLSEPSSSTSTSSSTVNGSSESMDVLGGSPPISPRREALNGWRQRQPLSGDGIVHALAEGTDRPYSVQGLVKSRLGAIWCATIQAHGVAVQLSARTEEPIPADKTLVALARCATTLPSRQKQRWYLRPWNDCPYMFLHVSKRLEPQLRVPGQPIALSAMPVIGYDVELECSNDWIQRLPSMTPHVVWDDLQRPIRRCLHGQTRFDPDPVHCMILSSSSVTECTSNEWTAAQNPSSGGATDTKSHNLHSMPPLHLHPSGILITPSTLMADDISASASASASSSSSAAVGHSLSASNSAPYPISGPSSLRMDDRKHSMNTLKPHSTSMILQSSSLSASSTRLGSTTAPTVDLLTPSPLGSAARLRVKAPWESIWIVPFLYRSFESR